MENNQSLFSLNIDPIAKAHLQETARWGRFLAIAGLVALGLLLLVFGLGIFFMTDTLFSDFGSLGTTGSRIGISFYLLVLSAIWFFPLLFLLRFSNKMRTALQTNDQSQLNASFQNLKALFRYSGIVTIIVLSLYALMILFFVIGAGVMGR